MVTDGVPARTILVEARRVPSGEKRSVSSPGIPLGESSSLPVATSKTCRPSLGIARATRVPSRLNRQSNGGGDPDLTEWEKISLPVRASHTFKAQSPNVGAGPPTVTVGNSYRIAATVLPSRLELR